MLGARATRSADRSTRSRKPLIRELSVSPPRVAAKKKSPAREPGELVRIEEKLEEKRTQLYDLLRTEDWPHADAEVEVSRWQMIACVRRTGAWKGGIDLNYRHQVTRIPSPTFSYLHANWHHMKLKFPVLGLWQTYIFISLAEPHYICQMSAI